MGKINKAIKHICTWFWEDLGFIVEDFFDIAKIPLACGIIGNFIGMAIVKLIGIW